MGLLTKKIILPIWAYLQRNWYMPYGAYLTKKYYMPYGPTYKEIYMPYGPTAIGNIACMGLLTNNKVFHCLSHEVT